MREEAERTPPHWATVSEMLDALAGEEKRGVYIIDLEGGREWRTWGSLRHEALRFASGLVARGVSPGDRVVVMLPTGIPFLAAFLGTIWIGAIPVPLTPPRIDHPNPFAGVRSLDRFLERIEARGILFANDLSADQRPSTVTKDLLALTASQAIEGIGSRDAPPPRRGHEEIAYIQPSSGTTGRVRAIVLGHHGVMHALCAMNRALAITDEDSVASWLPLDNIMGLLGAFLLSMYARIDAVLMDPERFALRPDHWLWAIHQHRATLTLAPNFAYHYCLRRSRQRDLEGLDLSSLRIALTGGEPVRARHIKAFIQRFSPHGLSHDVFVPVYGLSEATLALTCAPLDERLRLDLIHRPTLERHGIARPLAPEESEKLPRAERMHIVSVGEPMEHVDVRIVDGRGRLIKEDRHMGRIAFMGPSVMLGYLEETDAHTSHSTRRDIVRCLKDGWWMTGDLGYLVDNRLYVVDRAILSHDESEDVFLFPSEVELVVDAVDGVRAGASAGFYGDDSEDLVVVFEAQAGAPIAEVIAEIRDQLETRIGARPARIVALKPGSVPRTRDGKVRRGAAREALERGELGDSTRRIDSVVVLLNRARSDVLRATLRVRRHLSTLFRKED